MKGWQSFRQITQKICCSDEIANKVKQIEHNMYLMMEGNGFWIYKFPFDQCFSLHDLIESIKDKYVMIYKGQVLLIIQKIIEHLYEIHQINLTHDNLNAQNIYINFAKDSNSLTTYQQFIKIDSVYFLNYKCLQVELKEYIVSDDLTAIKKTILQLIQIFFDEKEDLTQIVKEFTNKSKIKNTNKLLKQINEYIYYINI